MSSTIQRAIQKQWIHPPSWVETNLHWEVWFGSYAYGIATDTSDMDVYAWAIPPKYDLFPHLKGEILGFGGQTKPFNVYQKHHVVDPEKGKQYDFAIYSIISYFDLCMDNNPNMIDSLFVPRRCILYSTEIGEHLRENRKKFLHKGSWHKYRGYAMSQLSKIDGKTSSSNPKRQETIERHGFDTKFATHAVRLLLQEEQILSECDIDLERNSDVLKSIRRGEWTLEYLKNWVQQKEASLELVFANSKIREMADEKEIKTILLECLEMHYGNLDHAIKKEKSVELLLADLENVLRKYR